MALETEKEVINEVATQLANLVNMYEADGVKVYLKDESSFCVKVIKDGKVIRCIRKGNDAFDVKKQDDNQNK